MISDELRLRTDEACEYDVSGLMLVRWGLSALGLFGWGAGGAVFIRLTPALGDDALIVT